MKPIRNLGSNGALAASLLSRALANAVPWGYRAPRPRLPDLIPKPPTPEEIARRTQAEQATIAAAEAKRARKAAKRLNHSK